MLGVSNEQRMMDSLWEAAEVKLELPELTAKFFFEPKGPMPSRFDNRRSYHRFYMRGKAILKRAEATFGIYTLDVSRQGIGFLSPVQLMPKESVELRLPNGAEYQLEIARCRRENENCFECGSKFVLRAKQA